MGYSEGRIPSPNAGTPRGMGDYDPPDDEPDGAQCVCCEEDNYLDSMVKTEHGLVCKSCEEDYDQCVVGHSPECGEGGVLKGELTYVGGDPTCMACMAEGEGSGA